VGAADVIAGTTDSLSGLVTPDDHTVAITLQQPYPVFLKMLAMPTAAIIPNGASGEGRPNPKFDASPTGTGPWVLSNWIHDQRLEFKRNPNYWGSGPLLDNLVYHVQTEDNVRYRQFEAGNFDIVQVGFQIFDSWQKNPEKEKLTTSIQELRTDFLGLMCSKKPLDNVRVRQALAFAVDSTSIFDQIQKKRGTLSHGPIPPGIPGYRPATAPRQHDVARAKALLQQAGVINLKLELWYRDEALNSEIVDAVSKDLQAAGVTVVRTPRDQAALRDGIHSGRADMFLGSWTLDYPDPENALYPPFHSRNIPRQGNQTHFRDRQVDDLLDKARATSNDAERIALYQQVEERVNELTPWICLFHPRTYYAVQPAVKGWSPALMYNGDRFNTVRKTDILPK